MKVSELMSKPVIRIHDNEPVAVAARTLAHYNIGAMPVCGADGRLCGVITDRDLVTRCLAAERSWESTAVKDVMTRQVLVVTPDTDVTEAVRIMGARQVRRLPVVENERLCGMLSLGDVALSSENAGDATRALTRITSNISKG